MEKRLRKNKYSRFSLGKIGFTVVFPKGGRGNSTISPFTGGKFYYEKISHFSVGWGVDFKERGGGGKLLSRGGVLAVHVTHQPTNLEFASSTPTPTNSPVFRMILKLMPPSPYNLRVIGAYICTTINMGTTEDGGWNE